MWRYMFLAGWTASAALIVMPTGPAYATSGWGCFKVQNVRSGDALSLRSGPGTGHKVVDRLIPGKHGIIAETSGCKPAGAKPSRLWCPVKHFNGDKVSEGWARLVYLSPSECP